MRVSGPSLNNVVELTLLSLLTFLVQTHAPTSTLTILLHCATWILSLSTPMPMLTDARLRDINASPACGALLPLALIPSLPPASSPFAIAASFATLFFTRAGCISTRVAASAAIATALLLRAFNLLSAAALATPLVPVAVNALVTLCPRSFTLAEAALVGTFGTAIFARMMRRIWLLQTADGDIVAIVEAALVGALLVAVLPLADCLRGRRSLARSMLLLLGAVVATYVYAWRFATGGEPIAFVWRYVVATRERTLLMGYWMALLGVVAAFPPAQSGLEKIVARKLYHVLALALFGGGLIVDAELTSLGMAVAMAGMIVVEVGRVCGVGMVERGVQEATGGLVDGRDCGRVVLTHIYLLVGCAGPVWCVSFGGGGNWEWGYVGGGLVSVCVMDSWASYVGKRWGRHTWGEGGRTMEGSLGGFVAAIVFGGVWGRGTALSRVIVGCLLSAAIEACTLEIDNLVLPAMYCAAAVAVSTR